MWAGDFEWIINYVWPKQKGFYPYEYMSGFEKFEEGLPSKEKFYSLLMDKTFTNKEYEHVLKV